METCTEDEMLAAIQVGQRVWFGGERIGYTVQARNARWIICTKPFAARKTVLYSIIDTKEKLRGPDDLVFGGGYETKEQCEANLERLVNDSMGLSTYRSTTLCIHRTR